MKKTPYKKTSTKDYYGALSDHPAPTSITKLVVSHQVLAVATAATLSKFAHVEELHLYPTSIALDFPLAVFAWKKLHTITIGFRNIEVIWPHLASLPHLRVLNLQLNNLQELPYELSNCRQLEELNWLETRFGDKFEGWHLLEQLPKLAWMNLKRATFKRPVLAGLEELDLKGLLLPKRHFDFFYKNNKEYCEQLLYRYQYTTAEGKSYKSLIQQAQAQQLSWKQRALMLQLLAGNLKKVATLATPERVLAITDWPTLEPLRLQAIQYYTQQWPCSTPLQPTAVLTILGKIASNKKDLRQQLKAVGLGYTPKIQVTTTHAILGQHSKGAYQEALAAQLSIVSEIQVLDYITAKGEAYLVQDAESSPEQIANIQQLLYSGQKDNTALALAFFEQGGFPKLLLTPLFFAYNMIEDLALRKEIGRLLRQHGSPAVIEGLQSISIGLYKVANEDHIKRHLQQLHKSSELDAIQLAKAIHQQTGHGLTFLLQVLSLEEGAVLLRQTMEGKTVHLDRMGLTSVPLAVYELKELEELNVYNNNLTTIPIKQLKRLPHLKTINAPFNYHLNKNKKWLQQMQEALPQVTVDF